jgi:hypothetical protein
MDQSAWGGSTCIVALVSVQVFDVSTFDMIAMVRLAYVPGTVEWIFQVTTVVWEEEGRCIAQFASSIRPCIRACLHACVHMSEAKLQTISLWGQPLAFPHRPSPLLPPHISTCLPAVQRGDAQAKLALSECGSPAIHIYDMRSGSNDAVAHVTIHAAPVTAMRFNAAANVVITTDEKGV